MRNKLLFVLLLPFFSISQSYEKITVGAGPEDFVLDTFQGNERLIISCDERRDKDSIVQGDIWTLDIKSKQTKVLPRINDRTTSFNPHGVHLLNENNANYLFVVNHYDKYKKNEIIRYVLKGDTLYYDTSFKYSSKINAVCAVSKNRFYITNDKVLNGKLVEYANAKFHTLAKGIHFPNGVNIKDDYLYYTTTLSGKVKKAKIIGVGKIEKSQKIAKIKGADNIRFYKNDLITTSHPKFRKFLKHLKNKDNPSPCDVYSIDLNTFNKKKLYSSSGVPISAVSTAILYNKQLYLAQVFEPFILAVDLE